MKKPFSTILGASLIGPLLGAHAWAFEGQSSPAFAAAEGNLLHPAPALSSGPLFPGILGQALADFDNDGDLDLFVTNSEGLPNYLYLNDGHGHFNDVARKAGVQLTDSYCVSVGLGDFDNDGRLDLLIGRQSNSSGAPSHPLLLKNMGLDDNGVPVFSDISDRSGISALAASRRALGFAVADYNRDGALDIFIGAFDLTHSSDANFPIGVSDPDMLLMNAGTKGGIPRFVDRTEWAGVAGKKVAGRTPETQSQTWYPHTWAVYSSDVNADGAMDIIVMNEVPGTVEIYLNHGNGRFGLMENEALEKAGGWMGIASTDFDGDGNLDYFITNLGAEMAKFGVPPVINLGAAVNPGGQPYHYFLSGTGNGGLLDRAAALDITIEPTLPPLAAGLAPGLHAYDFGWGATFFDANNDGYKDLYWVGAHWAGIPLNGVGRLLLNNSGRSFTEATGSAGLFNIPEDQPMDFANASNGYSVLSGDIDNDGDDDLVVVNGSDTGTATAPAGIKIFRNMTGNQNRQIKVSLRTRMANRFGIGSRVELLSVDAATARTVGLDASDRDSLRHFILGNYARRQVGEIVTTTSSFSAAQPMITFGLQSASELALVKVTWPDGSVSHSLVPPYQSTLTLMQPGSLSGSREGGDRRGADGRE